MPVTVRPAAHAASPWGHNPHHTYPAASSPAHLLRNTLSDESSHLRSDRRRSPTPPSSEPHNNLIQSSFSDLTRTSGVYAAKNGLVHALLEAYNMHHHIVLRPDDVWLAIVTQLSAFVNSRAEDLRDLLVLPVSATAPALPGVPLPERPRHNLHIETTGPLSSLDHGAVATQMTERLASHLADPSLRSFVLPSFSTTTETDTATAAVVFLGTMQKYFTYSWGTRCGIPSATLLGTRDDWASMLTRGDERLAKGTGLGRAGTAAWWGVLRPVLEGFVSTWDEPEGEGALRFWRGVCDEHVPNGSGATEYGGWITAFCYWDERGRCLHDLKRDDRGRVRLARSEIPMGFVKVPVTLWDDGHTVETEMVAGSVGIRVRNMEEETRRNSDNGGGGASPTFARRQGYDTLQPESGWFMYGI